MEAPNAQLVKNRNIVGLAQSLGEDIRQLMLSRNKQRLNIPSHYLVTNKVAINLNMFGTFMKDRIASNMQGSLTITMKLHGVIM